MTTGTAPHGPENTALAQAIYPDLKAAGLIETAHHRAVLRPAEGHVPARPLHQGRMPRLPRQGPVRRRLRGCGAVYTPAELINPYSALSGASAELRAERALLLQPVRPARDRLPQDLDDTAHRRGAARGAEQSPNDRARRSRQAQDGRTGHRRDAPYFGIEIPDQPGKYFYVLARRARGLPGQPEEPASTRASGGRRAREGAQL